MTYRYYSLILLVFTFGITSVPAEGTGGLSGGFLRMGSSARAIAMGSALTAGRNNESAIYYNPAGLSMVERFSFNATNQFLSLNRKLSIIDLSVKIPPGAGVGVMWVHAGVDEIDGRDSDGQHTEMYSANEDALYIGFAQNMTSRIHLGVTLKILQQQLPTGSSTLQGSGVGFDLGCLYQLSPEISIGLAIQNIKTSYQWSNQTFSNREHVYKDQFPTDVRLGVNYLWKTWQFIGDAGISIFEKKTINQEFRFGIEYIYNENLFTRVGFQGKNPTMGIGYQYSSIGDNDSSINYALVLESVTNPTHVISYVFNL